LDFTEEIFLPDVKEEEVSSKVLKKGRKKWESGSLVGFISEDEGVSPLDPVKDVPER
jgi:hypothetical protein